MRRFYISQIDLFLNEYVEDRYDDDEKVYEIEDIFNEEQFNKFKEFVIESKVNGDYFECLIDNEVRKVRFGVISHRKTSDGIRVRGPLVEKTYDDNLKPRRYDSNYQSNIQEEVITTKIINDRLISLLLEKGLFTKEEVDRITNIFSKDFHSKYFDYNTF